MSDIPRTLDKPTEGSYKGSPTIMLPDTNGGRPVVFGLRKARAILANLDAVQSFVARHTPDDS